MRSLLLASVLVFAASPVLAAEIPRGFDASQSELAKRFNENLRERAQRRNTVAPAALTAGWTTTAVGNISYLKDDGSHGCSGDPFSNAFFNDCVGGAIEAFYAANPSADPDFLATYLAWNIDAFFAFYSPQSNDVRGIGVEHFAGTDIFDQSSNNLQGFIFMNSVQLYDSIPSLPPELLFDLIWGQEVGHRWGAFVQFDDNGQANDAIQGRDFDNGGGHWSYHFDTDWSWMEGNDWKDNGDGSFTTDFDTFGQPGYSALDLYVMGLIPASAVPDMFYIDNPTGSAQRVDGPQILSGGPTTLSGDKRVVTIDDVIRLEGERSPSFSTADRRMQTNLLVILRSTDDPNDATLQSKMAQFEVFTGDHFSRDVRDLAFIGTNIGPLPANIAPAADFVVPASAKKGASVALDASGSSDADGDALSFVWDFGDGTGEYGAAAQIDHAFRKSGDLTVTLTAVDARGGSTTTTSAISVSSDKDEGLLGCGCTLATTGPSRGTSGLLTALSLLALGVIRRRT